MTSIGGQGVAFFDFFFPIPFFSFFFFESAPLLQIAWIRRPGMNNVRRCSGSGECQHCQHTSSIRAGSPSISRALRRAHAFQPHHQRHRFTFCSTWYIPKHTASLASSCHWEFGALVLGHGVVSIRDVLASQNQPPLQTWLLQGEESLNLALSIHCQLFLFSFSLFLSHLFSQWVF